MSYLEDFGAASPLRGAVNEVEELGEYLDHLEQRFNEAVEPPPALLQHNYDESSESAFRRGLQEDEAPSETSVEATVGHKVVARLMQAMDDDGRRRLGRQTPHTNGTGLNGALANEYNSLFEHLTGTELKRASTVVQSFYRGRQKRQRLTKWKAGRTKRLRLHFLSWKAVTNAQTFFDKILCRWVWQGWKESVRDTKRIREVTWKVFRGRIGQKALSISAVNLFFAEDSDPPDAIAANALHLGVRRQVLKFLLRAWQNEIKDWQRCRTIAIVTMQRALRRSKGARPHWTPELIGLVFHMWRRSLAFKRAFKKKARLPKYTTPDLPDWDKWVQVFMSRQLLKQKAAAFGLHVFQRNKLRRWRWYTRYMKGMAGRLEIAAQYYDDHLLGSILRKWLGYTRCRGRVFRRRVVYFHAWKAWAPRKKKLRQLKQMIAMKVTRNIAKCHIRKWSLCLNAQRLLSAFRLHRLTAKSAFYPIMGACYILNDSIPNYFLLWCFRHWKTLRARRVAWKSFYYLHQRNGSLHLMRTVFVAWSRSTGKWQSTGDTLSLEPATALGVSVDVAARVRNGFRPETCLSRSLLRRLLPGDDEVDPSVVELDSKPKTVLRDLERRVVDAVMNCKDDALEQALSAGARVDFVFDPQTGRTPLHLACSFFSTRFLKIIGLLLHCGADVGRRDHRGVRPLDLATNPQVAALLHTHSARVASSPSLTELSQCMELLALQWGEVGGVSLWRFVVFEFAGHNAKAIDNGLLESKKRKGQREHASHSELEEAVEVEDSNSSIQDAVALALAKKKARRLDKVCSFLQESQRGLAEGETPVECPHVRGEPWGGHKGVASLKSGTRGGAAISALGSNEVLRSAQGSQGAKKKRMDTETIEKLRRGEVRN